MEASVRFRVAERQHHDQVRPPAQHLVEAPIEEVEPLPRQKRCCLAPRSPNCGHCVLAEMDPTALAKLTHEELARRSSHARRHGETQRVSWL